MIKVLMGGKMREIKHIDVKKHLKELSKK